MTKGTKPRAVLNSLYIETEDLNTLIDRLHARYEVIKQKEVLVEYLACLRGILPCGSHSLTCL